MTVQNIMYTVYNFFVVAFFMDLDPDFPDRFRIFWPIRTPEKKSDPDPDPKH